MSWLEDTAARTGRVGEATLRDVAREAGVSMSTVSRVCRGDPAVSARTLVRVQAAMAALNFRPNLAARSLRSAKSFNICLLTQFFSSYFFGEAIRGAAHGCSEAGYNLVIEETTQGEGATAHVKEFLDRTRVDGVMLLPTLADFADILDMLEARGQPYVRIAPATFPGRSPSIATDDALAVRDLARHLWGLGHRRFAYAAGPIHHKATHLRRDSFFAALRALGARDEDLVAYPMSDALERAAHLERPVHAVMEMGRQTVLRLAEEVKRPTALFCFSDEMALGAMMSARDSGLDVPGDLAIAGFDDSEVSFLSRPSLTTIRQPIAEMVRSAALMIARDEYPETEILLPTELVVRGSTDPSAGSAR